MQGHPNIIKMLNSFQHNQKVFMVFELMNQTLLDMLQNSAEGKLEREQVRLIVYQMVKALEYMHSKNVNKFSKYKDCSQRYQAREYANVRNRTA